MKILPAAALNPLLLQSPKGWDVISVVRSTRLPMTSLCRRHHHLDCSDVLERDLGNPEFVSFMLEHDWRVPVREQIEHVLAFARETGLERLIVHCAMGISRSPAVAWCILADQLASAEAATAELQRIRPQAQPNDLILKLGLEVLELHISVAEVRRNFAICSTVRDAD